MPMPSFLQTVESSRFARRGSRFFEEFKKFVLRGSVMDLAIGVVIGAAFTGIVNSLVADIFMPIIGLITGGFDVSGQEFPLYKDAVPRWGKFLQTVLNFMIVGFCMFLVMKGVNALYHQLTHEEAKPADPSPTDKLLAEIRDLLKAREQPTTQFQTEP